MRTSLSITLTATLALLLGVSIGVAGFGQDTKVAPVRLDRDKMAGLNLSAIPPLSSTVGSEAWNSRDLKSRPH